MGALYLLAEMRQRDQGWGEGTLGNKSCENYNRGRSWVTVGSNFGFWDKV